MSAVPEEAVSAPAAASRYLPGGNTRTTLHVPPNPPYAVEGSGLIVRDTTGHEVIDLNNNYTSLIHGHCRSEVVDAAAGAVSTMISVGLPTPGEVGLASRLSERYPHADLWRFVNSGSEAVALALRLARAYTRRNLVIRFAGAYHGSSDQVLDVSLPGVGRGASSDTLTVPLEDAEAFSSAIREHGDDTAAVLIDLMPNRAGMQLRSDAFVEAVVAAARSAGALVIVDEVMTGRLEVGGLQQRFGLAPDLTTVGKIVGGGMPVGGVGGREDVMAVSDPRREGAVAWGGTFNANPVTMAAGAAALDLYTAEEVVRLNALGDALRTEIAEIGLTVNGSGSLMRIIHDDPRRLWWRCYEAGLLIGTNGLVCISTPMDEAAVEEIVSRFRRAVSHR